MNIYKEAFVTNLIRERAKNRAEKLGGTFSNRDAKRTIVPFCDWLYFTEGIVNWKELRKYDLWNYYLDYRVDCVRHGMLFQCGEVYGLNNV